MDRVEEYKENEIIRVIKRLINDEISKRIDEIAEAQKQEPKLEIEDYRSDIDEMIRDYITYNVSVTLDC